MKNEEENEGRRTQQMDSKFREKGSRCTAAKRTRNTPPRNRVRALQHTATLHPRGLREAVEPRRQRRRHGLLLLLRLRGRQRLAKSGKRVRVHREDGRRRHGLRLLGGLLRVGKRLRLRVRRLSGRAPDRGAAATSAVEHRDDARDRLADALDHGHVHVLELARQRLGARREAARPPLDAVDRILGEKARAEHAECHEERLAEGLRAAVLVEPGHEGRAEGLRAVQRDHRVERLEQIVDDAAKNVKLDVLRKEVRIRRGASRGATWANGRIRRRREWPSARRGRNRLHVGVAELAVLLKVLNDQAQLAHLLAQAADLLHERRLFADHVRNVVHGLAQHRRLRHLRRRRAATGGDHVLQLVKTLLDVVVPLLLGRNVGAATNGRRLRAVAKLRRGRLRRKAVPPVRRLGHIAVVRRLAASIAQRLDAEHEVVDGRVARGREREVLLLHLHARDGNGHRHARRFETGGGTLREALQLQLLVQLHLRVNGLRRETHAKRQRETDRRHATKAERVRSRVENVEIGVQKAVEQAVSGGALHLQLQRNERRRVGHAEGSWERTAHGRTASRRRSRCQLRVREDARVLRCHGALESGVHLQHAWARGPPHAHATAPSTRTQPASKGAQRHGLGFHAKSPLMPLGLHVFAAVCAVRERAFSHVLCVDT
eukprot:Opistho-1_new@42542